MYSVAMCGVPGTVFVRVLVCVLARVYACGHAYGNVCVPECMHVSVSAKFALCCVVLCDLYSVLWAPRLRSAALRPCVLCAAALRPRCVVLPAMCACAMLGALALPLHAHVQQGGPDLDMPSRCAGLRR